MNVKKHLSVYKGLPKDLYLLFTSVVINKMGGFIMPLLTLILIEKIGLKETEAGLFSTIAMLSQAPFIMIGGNLIDKFGSKKIIVTFQLIGSLIYMACGFMKPSITVAILIIVASDLYALASPAFNTIVPIVTPKPLIKKAYSLMYLGLNLGLAVGPLIGGVLFNNHLSILFITDALSTIVSTLLVLFFIKGKNEVSESPDFENNMPKGTDTNSIITFLYRNPMLVIFSIIMLIYNFCYIQWNFILPLQAVDMLKDNGAFFYSLLYCINAITVITVTPVLTSLTQEIDPLKSIFIGGILYLASFLMFSINSFMATFIIAIIIMTFGEIFISINSNNYIAKCTPKQYLGRANSMLFIINGIGFAIGPVVMGNIIVATSFRNAWLMVAALMFGGILAMYFVKRIEKSNNVENSINKINEEDIEVNNIESLNDLNVNSEIKEILDK